MGQEQVQQKWQEICWKAGAPGHEAERSLACKLMAEKLGPGTPAPSRVWLLKQLERIGRGECVEKVAAVVCDDDRLVRDAAIRALANNPDSAAGDQLRDAFMIAGDDGLRVALVNALGFRGEPASVEMLARSVSRFQKDPAVIAALARALGKIGTLAAIGALESALEQTRGPDRLQVGDALAKCCQRLFAEGRTSEARAIAKLLYQPDQPARLAGLEGLLSTAGDDAAATILQVLARRDALETSVAVGFVASVDSKGVKLLADGLNTTAGPEVCGKMIERAEQSRTGMGRGRDEVTYSVQPALLVGSEKEVGEIAQHEGKRSGLSPQDCLKKLKEDGCIIGTPEHCAQELMAFSDVGVDYLIPRIMGDKLLWPLETIRDRILPLI